MNIFSLFKRRKAEPQEMSPAAILRLTQEYVPEFYKDSRHFKDSKEFLERNELGLALESLIEMAVESGHYFSEDFWLDLAACANKMQMPEQAAFCEQQIRRNEKELGEKTIKGWTVDNSNKGIRIAEIIKDDWRSKRRKRDKLDDLIYQDGFHLKPNGRTGTIYYIEKGKVLEIDLELSASPDFTWLVFFDETKAWAIPNGEPFSADEKSLIREKLLQWQMNKRIKTDLK